MATQADQRLLTADEFLRIVFSSNVKAELDDGVVTMMAGGSNHHARVQMNLYRWFANALDGSPCQPYGSDMAVRTTSRSVRYPDLTVDCGPADEELLELQEPRVVVEVLSPTTRRDDEGRKLNEYRALTGLRTIAIIDQLDRSVRVFQRDVGEEWRDSGAVAGADFDVSFLGLTMPNAEIFRGL